MGTSLAVQQLGLCTSITGGTGLISGQETKIPHAVWCDKKKKEEEEEYRSVCMLGLLSILA